MSRIYAYLKADYSADEHNNFIQKIEILKQRIQQP